MMNRPSMLGPRVSVVAALCTLSLCWGCGQDGGGQTNTPDRNDGGVTQGGQTSEETQDGGQQVSPPAQSKLTQFESEGGFHQFIAQLAEVEKQRRQERTRRRSASKSSLGAMPTPPPAPGQAAPTQSADSAASSESDSEGGGESITNTQEQGVDEGGIIKVHGDHLVVLRRGRLFTISLSSGLIRPISMIDAFPQGATHGWYDEMLISGDTIVVVGFNGSQRATELGLFNVDSEGQLTHRATYYLRSNDYYSSRNYASRLIGNTLIFYMPYSLFTSGWMNGESRDAYTLPGVRRYTRGAQNDDWNEIITVSNVYQPIQETPNPVLHTVVTCDLSTPQMQCGAQGVIGPRGRNFYVSGNAVYIWVHGGRFERCEDDESIPEAVVYRMPLRGGEPGALRVSGAPVDQFSFKESDDNHLNVLVRAGGGGDWMWAPEVSSGDVALMRVSIPDFLEGVTTVPGRAYTALPRPQGYSFQNRFVGSHILYGTGSGWGRPTENHAHQVFIHPYAGGATTTLSLPHGVDRLEVMGSAAVVIGTQGNDLHFSAVELSSDPQIVGRYVQQGASQGETRSHGFFYRPITETEGMLGLPIRGGGQPGSAQLRHGSASVLFLHVQNMRFNRLGALASSGGSVNDNCQASCVDWYGNARPIFLRGRIYALLGYELVEGRVEGAQIREIARTNYYSNQPNQLRPQG